MSEEIIIEIDENGNTTIEVEGVADESCRQLTEPFERALGSVDSRTIKDAACRAEERARIKT